MKNLAETITQKKEAERVAYERYQACLLKEVCALCNRLDMIEPTSTDVVLATKFAITPNEKGDAYTFQVPALSAVVAVVERMSYIIKLRDKWLKLFRELDAIKEAIK